jgi:hypothetical protein
MNFYTQQHKPYCGIALHAKAMYVCILDQHGTKLVHKNLPTTRKHFCGSLLPIARISSSASHVCSPGSGWRTCVSEKELLLFSATLSI